MEWQVAFGVGMLTGLVVWLMLTADQKQLSEPSDARPKPKHPKHGPKGKGKE